MYEYTREGIVVLLNIEHDKAAIQSSVQDNCLRDLLECFPASDFHAQLTAGCAGVDRSATNQPLPTASVSPYTYERRPNRGVNMNKSRRNNTAQRTNPRRKATFDERHTPHKRRQPLWSKNRTVLGLSPGGTVELNPV